MSHFDHDFVTQLVKVAWKTMKKIAKGRFLLIFVISDSFNIRNKLSKSYSPLQNCQ